jgi:hypothetical protein
LRNRASRPGVITQISCQQLRFSPGLDRVELRLSINSLLRCT